MKPVCCDTSFLFALYGNDAHSAQALAHMRGIRQPLTLSLFNEFEWENALRFSACRKIISGPQLAGIQARFDSDRKGRLWVQGTCNLASVLEQARQLSALHTPTGGYRAFDILHVAAALELGAGEFLSFDLQQRKLGMAVGLTINP